MVTGVVPLDSEGEMTGRDGAERGLWVILAVGGRLKRRNCGVNL